jgi:hypothetical protein
MPRTIGEQKLFATYFAGYTGLSLPVVEAWLLNEQPPGSPSKPGSNNWLNIGYTDAGPNSEYAPIASGRPQAAARASAEWLKKNQPSILSSVGKSQVDQASAIINSNWASSHYGYDVKKFLGIVSGGESSKENASILGEIPGPQQPLLKSLEGLGGVPGIPNPLGGLEEGIGVVKTSAELIQALTEPKTWVRIGEGIVGLIIVLSAMKTLSRKYGPSRVVVGQGREGAMYARKAAASSVAKKAVKVAVAEPVK